MQRLITDSEESLVTRIEDERNSDHNGALPSFLAVVGGDLNLKDLFQNTKCATDLTRYTWGDVSKT
eukprot:7740033-Karenia_brevis.AAC.1